MQMIELVILSGNIAFLEIIIEFRKSNKTAVNIILKSENIVF